MNWKCENCGQMNAGWATTCGRCDAALSWSDPKDCPEEDVYGEPKTLNEWSDLILESVKYCLKRRRMI